MKWYDNKTSSHPKVCIGRMCKRIQIQTRDVVYLSSRSEYSFTTVYTVWANVKTTDGLVRFSDININDNTTHIFYIRKIEGLTTEYWVNYNDNRYRILRTELMNDDKWHALYCKQTGDDDLDGSMS